jgi:hypothetical protein
MLYSTYRTSASWGGVGLAPAGFEQNGGTQDEQGGGGVAQLERQHAHQQPSQPPAQHRADTDADGLVSARPGHGGVPDGVDDRHRGEQPGDDRQPDGGPDADQVNQGNGQQRPADRPQVVHRPLESVGAAIHRGCTTSASRALRAGTRRPRAAQDPARKIPACHGAAAAPIVADSTAVVVYPPIATRRRRPGSSASAPPASIARTNCWVTDRGGPRLDGPPGSAGAFRTGATPAGRG